jgi:hypothetical protein
MQPERIFVDIALNAGDLHAIVESDALLFHFVKCRVTLLEAVWEGRSGLHIFI